MAGPAGYAASLCAILVMLVGGSPSHAKHSTLRSPGSQTLADRGPDADGHGPIHPIQWVVLGQPSESWVRIGNMVGWCPDLGLESRPRISGVRQVDRAGRVMLTAYLTQRNPAGCAGVETLVETVVHIRHGLKGRPLYDGSRTPPVRRWPR